MKDRFGRMREDPVKIELSHLSRTKNVELFETCRYLRNSTTAHQQEMVMATSYILLRDSMNIRFLLSWSRRCIR
jgi:hypothetical protein